jgi:hypothetical protein
VSVPELRPALNWSPQSKQALLDEENNRDSCGSAAAVGATVASAYAHGHPDDLVVFLRWRVTPATTLRMCGEWSSVWVPYTSPLHTVITPANGKTVAETHSVSTTTTTSGSVGLDSATTRTRQTQSMGSAQLLLGRSALTDIATTTSCGAQGVMDREALKAVAATVSRAHCTVHFHCTGAWCGGTSHFADHKGVLAAEAVQCHSVDVFAASTATAVNGVPLHPHYRYHFHTADDACCPGGVMTLRLGAHCTVEVALRGVPSDLETEDLRTTGCVSGSPAVHRAPVPQRLHPPPLPPPPPPTTDTAATLARGSTMSLITAESTAVLATLSNLSEPVALSEVDGDGILQSQPVDAVVAEALLEDAQDDARPKLPKRRSSARAAAPKTTSATLRATATRQPRRGAVPREKASDDVGDEEAEVPAVPEPSATVIFTTGVRLSEVAEKELKGLGALVNPPLRLAPYARLLVVQRPLVRSVKLLTVLPYVGAVVHDSWLHTALHTHSLDIPVQGFLYSERRLPDSIESLNSFELRETLATPPAERQKLLSGQRFWVHKAAAPQDPPINDLKTVLIASGGVVTRRVSEADVLVMPQQRPELKCWKALLDEVGGLHALTQRKQSGLLLVVPDDIFKCVLQQRPLMHSTVAIPRTQLSVQGTGNGAKGTSRPSKKSNGHNTDSGRGRRSSQGTRKTPRNSTTQRSPRPSTRRRSS